MSLIEAINSRRAVIGVVGLGYVGLPLAIEFCKQGFRVIGFDPDQEKISALERGESYIRHISSEKIEDCKAIFEPTGDFDRLAEADCIIVCVPTPLDAHREPEMKYVFGAAETISRHLRREQLVVLESTTYPGTTDEDMRDILEKSGLKAGVDFCLAYSPEREDPNNPEYSTATIPKVVGGYTEKCLAVAVALYDSIVVRTVPVSSTRVAEASKLLENIYRSVNIALVNELKVLFDRMDIDIWEAIEAAKTKPFGFHPFYPGPGLGGHCVPIDPFYLTWKAKEYGFATRFIELAGTINTDMPHYVIGKIVAALNKSAKSVSGASILLLGMAYKRDVDDQRESSSLVIARLLREMGATISYSDPHIPRCAGEGLPEMKSVEVTEEMLRESDAVVLLADHSCYDYEFIGKHAGLIIDTRNAFGSRGIFGEKIIKA